MTNDAQAGKSVSGQFTEAVKGQTGKPMIALLILFAVLDAINAGGEFGAPNGVIYSALMAFGATLDQHQRLITFLTSQGYVTVSGNVLHLTEAGVKLMNSLAPLST
jgi:uncharacterized membrane protein